MRPCPTGTSPGCPPSSRLLVVSAAAVLKPGFQSRHGPLRQASGHPQLAHRSSVSGLKWFDRHVKGRAENSFLAHLYSCTRTRVAPSVKKPGGKSCLQAGKATIFFTDRQQEPGGGADGEGFIFLFCYVVVRSFPGKLDTMTLI